MNLKKLLNSLIIIILFLSVASLPFIIEEEQKQNPNVITISKEIKITDPPSLQVYCFVKKHCKKYNIPEEYMWGLLYQETRYGGPFMWNYKTNHISSVGALGPCQILLSTAKGINGEDSVSKTRLLTDIEYNIETSCKLIKRLRKRYSWGETFGYYNTGQPIINQYALNILNKQYIWEK